MIYRHFIQFFHKYKESCYKKREEEENMKMRNQIYLMLVEACETILQ